MVARRCRRARIIWCGFGHWVPGGNFDVLLATEGQFSARGSAQTAGRSCLGRKIKHCVCGIHVLAWNATACLATQGQSPPSRSSAMAGEHCRPVRMEPSGCGTYHSGASNKDGTENGRDRKRETEIGGTEIGTPYLFLNLTDKKSTVSRFFCASITPCCGSARPTTP